MLHYLRTAPTDAPRFDADPGVTEAAPQSVSAGYSLAFKADDAQPMAERTTFSIFDKNDRALFFAAAFMMLLPLVGADVFNRV